jgi:hypothetical protein
MDVNVALEALRGPRGGNVEHPQTRPADRRKHFNGEIQPNGQLGLHRANGWTDTTAPGRKNEQPWHRMAAYMLNAGRTNSEIALAADVTPETVSHIRAQRWFQELCATIANTEGEEIVGAARSHVLPSIERVAHLAEYSENERVKLAANIALIEQGHGKPVQKTVSFVASTSFSSPADEMAEITEQLRALRSQSPEIPEVDASVK